MSSKAHSKSLGAGSCAVDSSDRVGLGYPSKNACISGSKGRILWKGPIDSKIGCMRSRIFGAPIRIFSRIKE